MAAYPGGVYGAISTPDVPSGGPASINSSTAKMPIGAMFRHNNGIYRYVKHAAGTGTVATVVGGPAYAKTLTPAATATDPATSRGRSPSRAMTRIGSTPTTTGSAANSCPPGDSCRDIGAGTRP